VITDFEMPEMKGVEVAEQIRKTNLTVPILILTGHSTKEMAIKSMNFGVNGIIEKPFEPEQLLSVCNKYVETRRLDLERESREIEELTSSFVEEAKDQLSDLDQYILRLEEEVIDQVVIDSIFRQIHSVKGTAGALPRAHLLAQLAHDFETVLSKIKQKKLTPSSADINLFLKTHDMCMELLKSIEDRLEPTENQMQGVDSLCETLKKISNGSPAHDVAPAVAESAKPKETQEALVQEDDGVFVSTEKLNDFLGLSAEMTVLKNYFQLLVRDEAFQSAANRIAGKIEMMLQAYNKISDSLQKQIMSIRQVRMDKVCSKLPRLVRSTSQELKKKVILELNGMELGVDKMIAKDLAPALTHLIRNSIDHGIESQDQRIKSGKTAEGKIKLECSESDGMMYFYISDDGAGLRKELILKKAIEKGLISEPQAQKMPDEEIFQLIFHAGFSTAAQVTSVSGRGVGMDVVKSMVDTHKGKIRLSSEMGKGTVIKIQIPAPKSVLVEQTVLVQDLDQLYAIPLIEVLSIDFINDKKVTDLDGSKFVEYRGESVPLLSYRSMIEKGISEEYSPKHMIVIVTHKNRKLALRVDSIIGQYEAVVMPFDRMTNKLPGFKGTSLVGDGQISYVASAEGFFDLLNNKTQQAEMVA